jgi:putative membrane protein insertion efficiency factor
MTDATLASASASTSVSTSVRPSLPARVVMLPIRAWRLLSVHLPPRCRFYPSCSQYALEALTMHGAARGSWLAVRRVSRCHPWHDGGLDPVPLANVRSCLAAPVGAVEEG